MTATKNKGDSVMVELNWLNFINFSKHVKFDLCIYACL